MSEPIETEPFDFRPIAVTESVYEITARLLQGMKPAPRRTLHCGWLVPYYLHLSREIAQETDVPQLVLGKDAGLLGIDIFVEQKMANLEWEIREGVEVRASGHISVTAEVLREMGDWG